ncbi:hypothetical protein TDB9533_03563 [Thalassocella blandensis]|nr:hypothetical protein TDB9533_03563 [Thalassocella blandensis]
MASFKHCISAAQKAGRISKEVAERLSQSEDVEAELNGIVANLSRQRRETAVTATRISQAWEKASNHSEGSFNGIMSLLTSDNTGKAGYANVEYLAKYYEGKFHSRVADMLNAFRTRKLGFSQDEEGLKKLVKAIYGEEVGDPTINKFAAQWHNLVEELRVEFNKRGGSISKNDSYLMPQHHDAQAVQKVGFEKWKQGITPKLDRSKMLDDIGNPISDEQLSDSLKYVFETITSHGLNKVQELSVPRLGKKLARKHSERRFIYFKDAESWLEYQRDFGKGDVFSTLTGHIDTMSHDIALMEIMGPSPDSTFKSLVSEAEKSGGLGAFGKKNLEATYANVSGKTNQGELTGLSDFMQSTKNLLTASTLGGTFLSSLADVGFQALTSSYVGVPFFKVIKRQFSLMTSEEGQVAAVKLGFIGDAMIGRMHAANRYADVYGTGVTAKVAEGVMRASLLAPWTDAGRKAFGMEFSALLAENFGKQFDELDSNLLRGFKEYGITPEDWNVFRKSTPFNYSGAKFADLTQEGGKKFHQMIMSETDYAVPTPNARVRAITNGGKGRGTITGQAWRSVWFIKSFAVTIAMSHFYRAAYQATTADKLKYIAALTATTTVMGGLSLQMKDVAKGRDPRKVDEKFMLAALSQGGGLGIFGDFVFSDVNRFGGSIQETLAGPLGELANNVGKLTLGNVRQAIAGEETNVLGETVKFINRYTPDIWQTQLFTNALFDQFEIMADPKAEKKFNRIVRKRRGEYDQGYWWKPGKVVPDRAPDLSEAFK